MTFKNKEGSQLIPSQRKAIKKKILEKNIEAYLVTRIKLLGGVAEKFVSPNRRSVPDRIIFFPGKQCEFAECKAPGKRATPAQSEDHKRRRKLGYIVHVLDTYESIDEVYPKTIPRTRR